MLKRFEVENYKNFEGKTVFDFGDTQNYPFHQECLKNGCTSKSLLFGRQGAGKTNLGRAMMDIAKMINPLLFCTEEETIPLNMETDGEVTFQYDFLIEGHIIQYRYKRENSYSHEYTKETMYINGEMMYDMDYKNHDYNLSALLLGIVSVEDINGFIEKISNEDETKRPSTFLQWITLFPREKREKKSIIDLLADEIKGMRFLSIDDQRDENYRQVGYYFGFLREYAYLREKANLLDKFQDFLNKVGVSLPYPLKHVRTDERVPWTYSIFFDTKKPISFFGCASQGLLTLFDIFMCIYGLKEKKNHDTFLYLDGMDAFLHYEVAENLFVYLKNEFPNMQIIWTTHKTNMMSNLISRPDCISILSMDGRITPLYRSTCRELKEGHNLEKMYISGEFSESE